MNLNRFCFKALFNLTSKNRVSYVGDSLLYGLDEFELDNNLADIIHEKLIELDEFGWIRSHIYGSAKFQFFILPESEIINITFYPKGKYFLFIEQRSGKTKADIKLKDGNNVIGTIINL